MLFWILKVITFIPVWILYPVIVKGRKNLPKGKCVFVINHRSNRDSIIIVSNFWRTQYILAKKEIIKNKFCAWFFKKLHIIPIDREKVELSAIKACLKVINDNKTLTIFPEGTRNKTKEVLLEIKGGAGMLASRTNAPIVPIWIAKKQKPFILNKIIIGKPFTIDKSQSNEANDIIKEKLLETYEISKNKK